VSPELPTKVSKMCVYALGPYTPNRIHGTVQGVLNLHECGTESTQNVAHFEAVCGRNRLHVYLSVHTKAVMKSRAAAFVTRSVAAKGFVVISIDGCSKDLDSHLPALTLDEFRCASTPPRKCPRSPAAPSGQTTPPAQSLRWRPKATSPTN
jgi:hypothetical protein